MSCVLCHHSQCLQGGAQQHLLCLIACACICGLPLLLLQAHAKAAIRGLEAAVSSAAGSIANAAAQLPAQPSPGKEPQPASSISQAMYSTGVTGVGAVQQLQVSMQSLDHAVIAAVAAHTAACETKTGLEQQVQQLQGDLEHAKSTAGQLEEQVQSLKKQLAETGSDADALKAQVHQVGVTR